MPVRETRARVHAIDVLGRRYRRLRIATDWDAWMPGQFVMVRVPGNTVLLRRPFGIVDIADGVLEICFKVVGAGTEALARVRPGDDIDILGPLGRGFAPMKGATHLLVAGGYGIAPLVGFARCCIREGHKVVFIYGAKTRHDLLYIDELEGMPIDLHLSTDDGSHGVKGTAVDLLEKQLKRDSASIAYACGPHAMMKAAVEIAARHAIPAYVSMDEYMACGIGVCLGCVCESKNGDRVRACREGPVFDARELRW